MRRIIPLFVLLLFIVPIAAQAQTETWCKTWSGADIPFFFAAGYQGTTASGLDTTDVFVWGGATIYQYYYRLLTSFGDIPARYVTTLELEFDTAPAYVIGGAGDYSILPFNNDSHYIYNSVTLNGTKATININAFIYNLAWHLNTDTVDPGYIHTVTLRGQGTIPVWMGADNCSGGGGTEPALPDAVRPLTEADEAAVSSVLYDLNPIQTLSEAHNNQVFDATTVLLGNDLNSVAAWSSAPGAKVHVATDGYVQSIRRLNWTDCVWGQYGDIAGTTHFVGWESGDVHPCQVSLYDLAPVGTNAAGTAYSDVALASYYIDPTNASLVTINTGQYYLTYLVKNASEYVLTGDSVLAGCVLGETVGLTAVPATALNWDALPSLAFNTIISGWLGFVSSLSDFAQTITPDASYGYVNVSLTNAMGEGVELLTSLSMVPTNDDRCNNSGEYSGCLTDNPRLLSSGTGWQASGNVEWIEPGVILDPGESINQLLNLNPAGNYTLTVLAESPGVEGELMGVLGSVSSRQTVGLEWSSLQYAASPVGAGDAGGFWTLSVQNTGESVVSIKSVCVTSGDAPENPTSCYFTNHSFASGTAGWTVSSGVTDSDQALLVPDDGVITQTVHLYPKADGAASYQLTVYADWWYDGTVAPVGPEASVQYEWPSGTGYVTLEPEIVSGGLAYGMGSIVYRATINVSTETTGTLNLRVQTTSGGTGMTVYGLRLTEACLSGKFQQTTGGTVPALTADCSYVSRPRNNDPAAWIQWQTAKLNQFFQCDLMVLLNKIWKSIRDIFSLVGWSMRWIQASATSAGQWAGTQLFPWFGGHFRNIAIGQVTNITSEGSATIWDVLVALVEGVLSPITEAIQTLINIVSGAANLLIGVGTVFIMLVLQLATQMMSFAQLAQALLVTIIGAYNNSAPVTIPGMPYCTGDPHSNPFCIGIWVLDNTVFSGTGSAIIPLIVGVLSIHLILWVVGEIKTTIEKVGQVV